MISDFLLWALLSLGIVHSGGARAIRFSSYLDRILLETKLCDSSTVGAAVASGLWEQQAVFVILDPLGRLVLLFLCVFFIFSWVCCSFACLPVCTVDAHLGDDEGIVLWFIQ